MTELEWTAALSPLVHPAGGALDGAVADATTAIDLELADLDILDWTDASRGEALYEFGQRDDATDTTFAVSTVALANRSAAHHGVDRFDVALDDATTGSAAASFSRPTSAKASSSPTARRLWSHLDAMSEKEGGPHGRCLRQLRQ